MKKKDFKKLAAMGIAAGLMVTSSAQAQDNADAASEKDILAGAYAAGGCGHSGCAHSTPSSRSSYYIADSDTYMKDDSGQMMMTDDQFMNQLTDEDAKRMYKNMSPEGKAMAMKMASMYKDYNMAVKMAAQKMQEKRMQMGSGYNTGTSTSNYGNTSGMTGYTGSETSGYTNPSYNTRYNTGSNPSYNTGSSSYNTGSSGYTNPSYNTGSSGYTGSGSSGSY